MKLISSKKIFCFFSVVIFLLFAIFIALAKIFKLNSVLLSAKTCSTFYLCSYMGFCAVLYCLDSQKRQEPAFLELYCLPILSLLYLLVSMIIAEVSYGYMIIAFLSFGVIFIAGYLFDKYLINKVMMKRYGYQLFLFLYAILHLTSVLIISMKVLNLL